MVGSKNKRAKLQKRRAISTIVGGAIFLVLFASAFSTFFVAMDFQRDTINTQRTISDSIMEKTKEQFAISVSTDEATSNKLGIQVKNQGTNPIEIGNIWIINQSGNYPAEKIPINYTDAIIPPGYGSNILENTHLTMQSDDYEIKVISTLGTIKKSDLTIGSGNNLRAELFAVPPIVKINQNVTLIMHVENIGNSRILNVHPFNDYPNINLPFDPPNPPIPNPVDLDPGEGAFFNWEYVTTGTTGSTVIFDSYATGQEEDTGFVMNSNTAVEKIELTEPDEVELIVLTQDLISRPEIFMVIPSVFGDASERGLWGVNVVNPTSQPMKVSKVVVSLVGPRADEDDKFFNAPINCSPQTVAPTPDFWSCPAHNQLMWKNTAAPITVEPFSVFPFLAQVRAGTIDGSSNDMETILVHTTVFADVGEFAKAGYATSMDTDTDAMVNVYLAKNPASIAPADLLANVTKIQSADTVKFNATLADFATNPLDGIDGTVVKSKLIVNVPKGWGNPTIGTHTGFNAPTVIPHTDGSYQIFAELSNDLTSGARTIEFTSAAPTVSSKQMYVMYILAEGRTIDDFTIGPLSEIVLQVVPP